MNIIKKMKPAEASEIRKCPFASDLFVDYGEQKVYYERTPNLYFNGVFIVSKEKLQWEVLFELFEK